MFTGSGSPDTLQEAQVLAMSQADCVDIHEGSGRPITEDMICVGHDNDIYTGSCYVSLLINYIKSHNLNEVFRIHTTSKSCDMIFVYQTEIDIFINKNCIPVGCVPPTSVAVSPSRTPATYAPSRHAHPFVMYTPCQACPMPCTPPLCGQTDTYKNITFPQLLLQAVVKHIIISQHFVCSFKGDSGGPFVCRRNPDDDWTLIGITSWAVGPCGDDFYPSAYSRTAYFRDWINEICGDCIAN